MMQLPARIGPLIDGRQLQTTSAGPTPHINPADGKEQASVLVGGDAEIDAAARSGIKGAEAWQAMKGNGRRDCLNRLAQLVEDDRDTLNRMAALECGTPVSIGGGPDLALSWIRYYAGWADKVEGTVAEPLGSTGFGLAQPEPYGLIGVIIPWNSPLVALAMTAVPAMAAGNAVIVKPPSLTPFVAGRLGELALEAGIPAGVLNIVPGDAEAGEALVAHRDVGKISFTGGGATARAVMHKAADHLKPVALELGGKSANLVFDDADLQAAAEMATIAGLMVLSGQGCVLPTRVYAQDAIFEEFVDRVCAIAGQFKIGDPLDTATTFGPVINDRAADRIESVIERARKEAGGRLVLGGRRAGGVLAEGYYIEPTIFADIDHNSQLAREEVFGPVLSIMRFSDEADAVGKANDSDFGLGAYVHTNDAKRAHRVARALKAGAVSVNGMLPMAPNLPFGGVKQSGFGREGGRAGLEEFMHIKQMLFHA